jgi:hypothetical protein
MFLCSSTPKRYHHEHFVGSMAGSMVGNYILAWFRLLVLLSTTNAADRQAWKPASSAASTGNNEGEDSNTNAGTFLTVKNAVATMCFAAEDLVSST